MSLQISPELEARLAARAQEAGVSVEALLERLLGDEGHNAKNAPRDRLEAAGVPIWDSEVIGSLHRRDIYDDVE